MPRCFLPIRSCRWVASLFLPTLLLSTLWLFNVPTRVTPSDRLALTTMIRLQDPQLEITGRPQDWEQELAFLQRIQRIVMRTAPIQEGIPEGEAREPGDLYLLGRGLCYDRSRSIEKLLTLAGFKNRHLSLYRADQGVLSALLGYRSPSHAVTEVRTSRGWMVIDSNTPWMSLGRDGVPISMKQIARFRGALDFATPPPAFYCGRLITIRGLYSRHGRFFPPHWLPVDANFPELMTNFLP